MCIPYDHTFGTLQNLEERGWFGEVFQCVADPSKPGELYYYCWWSWNNNIWDIYWDTYDLVSMALRNDDGWSYDTAECYAYDNFGTQTGYTNGMQHSGVLTLRGDYWGTESGYGKIYNVEDKVNDPLQAVQYKAYQLKVSTWLYPGSTSTNYIKSDFEHNWKTTSLQGNATINSTNLKSFTLNVSYTNVRDNFQRGSNSLLITRP